MNQQAAFVFKPEEKEDMPGDGFLNHFKDLLVAFPFFEGDGQHVDLPHLIVCIHVEGFGCEGMAPNDLLNIIDRVDFFCV